MKRVILVIVSLFLFTDIFACTSAIFTGKATADGRPLMWKNRDTDNLENRLQYFDKNSLGLKYSFVGLVNSSSKGGEVWSGSNEVGFCIMNTASYNIDIVEDRKFEKDGEGRVMYMALSVCKTVEDFEYFLDTLSKPAPVEANFGVIDAQGGAAYYEVNSRTWIKRDANDPTLAPNGYLIVTNFSFTGRADEGYGYIRHASAEYLINQAFNNGVKFTPDWIMNNLSRSFYHSLFGVDVVNSGMINNTNGWFTDQDFISRKSTSSISIFQGATKDEDPGNTVFWCALGYGPLGVCMPVIVKYLPMIPEGMEAIGCHGKNSNQSLLNLKSLEIKKKIFPIVRGSGPKYVNVGKLFNTEGNGYTQIIQQSEKKIFAESYKMIEKIRKTSVESSEINELYRSNSSIALSVYKELSEK